MRQFRFLLLTVAFFGILSVQAKDIEDLPNNLQTSAQVLTAPSIQEGTIFSTDLKGIDVSKMTWKERRAIKKELRNAIDYNPTKVMLDDVALVVIAIFIAPLAVFLKAGLGTDFWIDLVLWILVPWVGGFIYALYVILMK